MLLISVSPGDPIEHEIIPDIDRAWHGESILPKQIISTDWGKIFLAYYPIHGENKEVIGVLGIEFDAEREYNTYHDLMKITPMIIGVACLTAAWIARHLFKRLSNPRNQDLYNTDQLTQLKNRNAFDFDMKNLSLTVTERLGILVLDIDHLKAINDEFGHLRGDEYIAKTALAIRNSLDDSMWAYRVGGDEFVIFMNQATQDKLLEWKKRFIHSFDLIMKEAGFLGDISIGMAIYESTNHDSIYETYRKADKQMYHNKQQKKA